MNWEHAIHFNCVSDLKTALSNYGLVSSLFIAIFGLGYLFSIFRLFVLSFALSNAILNLFSYGNFAKFSELIPEFMDPFILTTISLLFLTSPCTPVTPVNPVNSLLVPISLMLPLSNLYY